MGRGGKRVGSGRKPLEKRETKESVLSAHEKIDKAQPLAAKTLVAALKALNEKGFPDHSTRTKAAAIILNKRIPDLARQEVTGKDGEKLNLGVIVYPGNKKPAGAP